MALRGRCPNAMARAAASTTRSTAALAARSYDRTPRSGHSTAAGTLAARCRSLSSGAQVPRADPGFILPCTSLPHADLRYGSRSATAPSPPSPLRLPPRMSSPAWTSYAFRVTSSPDLAFPSLHRTRRSYHGTPRKSSAWAAAVSVASNVITNAVRRATAPKSELELASSIDPLRAVAEEMKHLTSNMRVLLESGHPSLERVAKYYTDTEGKKIRPLIVLLMSRATAMCPRSQQSGPRDQAATDAGALAGGAPAGIINAPISPADPNTSNTGQQRQASNDTELPTSSFSSSSSSSYSSSSSSSPPFPPSHPSSPSSSSPPSHPSSSSPPHPPPSPPPSPSTATPADGILPSQRRLAEIAELIHTASLFHDDVIDVSESRRGGPSANLAFGNKMAVLAGDFLLGRASLALARLRNVEVVELLSTVIANLVEGEFMQLKNTSRDERSPKWTDDTFSYYLQKTYLKSASLLANSCRAAAVLSGRDGRTVESAYLYGKNLGLAFQLIDDLLDYTRSTAELGKPAGADLQLGLATAPLLFAWKAMPELGTLVGRKFRGDGDVEKARQLVLESDGVEQTRALAQEYADQAVAALQHFPDSEAKDGLIQMAARTLQRRK